MFLLPPRKELVLDGNDLVAVLGPYDHGYLNSVPPFDEINPTAENLARVVYEALEARDLAAGSAQARRLFS